MFNLPAYPTLSYLIPLGFVSFAVLFVVFLLLSVLFVRMLIEASSLKEGSERTFEEARSVLESAQEHAFSLITDANKSAEKMLEDASYLSQDLSERFDSQLDAVARAEARSLEDVSENLIRVHRRAILEASKGNVGSIKELSEEFRHGLAEEIKEFRGALDTMTETAKKDLDAELKDYKASRIRRIDSAVRRIVEEASMKIIGKSLSVEDHAEYIVKVLDEARKSGEFADL